jgi:hypothetical protein
MLIWLGVVATVLTVVMMGVLYGLFLLVEESRKSQRVLQENVSGQVRLYQEWDRASDAWLEKIRGVFSEGGKVVDSHAERILADFKQATSGFAKSEQELADNLGALLREIKVSKQLAQGVSALGEQQVLATEKLWKLIQVVREGPRAAANIAPTDQQIVDGQDKDQEEQMLAMLRGVSARVVGDLNDGQE